MRMPFGRRDETTPVEDLIAKLLHRMQDTDPGTEEYREMIKSLDKLNEVNTKHRADRVSKDTIVNIIGSLAGIMIIVLAEQKYVMNSKGFSQIIRPKS